MTAVGIDVGYSNLKIKADDGNGGVMELIYPSGAGPASHMPNGLNGQATDGIEVLVDGEPWRAGVRHDHLEGWKRELHEDYASTQSYRALVSAGLAATGHERISHLVTGLPVNQFFDKKRVASLRDSLTGIHYINSETVIQVDRVTVLPQPAGAYMHLLDTFQDTALLEEAQIIVIDPGFFSLDWVAMRGGSIRKSSSGTSLKAVSRLLDAAADGIEREHEGRVERERIEQALRSHKSFILLHGQRVSFHDYLTGAIRTIAPQAMSELRETMREEAQAADIVMFAGGGAKAYAKAARAVFPKARVEVPKHPVMANVRGYYSYASRHGSEKGAAA